MTELFEPISLGYACDGKYQIARNLYRRHYPDGDETSFRNMLFGWPGSPRPFRRHIFDWMICPHEAVCAYLERDFQGVFEREDLVIRDEGVVGHRDLLTLHPHDFHAPAGERLTEAMVDAQYADFRSKYEYLADRFRRHLQTSGPYLYVYKEIRKLADAERLTGLLGARSADHRFEILFVDVEGAVNQVLNDPRMHKGWLPARPVDKAPERLWEGDDEAWDKILKGFPLGLPASSGAPPQAEPVRVEAAAETGRGGARPPKAGWRTLIETRHAGEFLNDYQHVGDAAGRARYYREGARHGFDGPEPDDHLFCQFIPAEPLAAGGWARLSLSWPKTDEPRAQVVLQDQQCRHGVEIPRGRTVVGDQETIVLRLHPGVDHLRLVMLPSGQARSALPAAITLEAHEPALEPPRQGWAERLKGLLHRR